MVGCYFAVKNKWSRVCIKIHDYCLNGFEIFLYCREVFSYVMFKLEAKVSCIYFNLLTHSGRRMFVNDPIIGHNFFTTSSAHKILPHTLWQRWMSGRMWTDGHSNTSANETAVRYRICIFSKGHEQTHLHKSENVFRTENVGSKWGSNPEPFGWESTSKTRIIFCVLSSNRFYSVSVLTFSHFE